MTGEQLQPLGTRELQTLLTEHWGLRHACVEPLGGGLNSVTWLVEHSQRRYVAKHVTSDGLGALARGCQVATSLADAGLRTGRPVPSQSGDLVLTDARLALLEHLPGRPLNGRNAEDQRAIATTLADVHRLGRPEPGPGAKGLAKRLGVGHIDPPAWLTRAVAQARSETDDLPLTWSVLHTDPAPEAFLHDDATSVTGLIDWAGSVRGPVLYDVASAVMYLGGAEHAQSFLDTYRSAGPVDDDELGYLDAYQRLRWTVQALYFTGRVAAGDLTGLDDATGNVRGLDDARRSLAALGADVT